MTVTQRTSQGFGKGRRPSMTDNTPATEDEQRIEELYEAWIYFDETGDESVILSMLADDVVVIPPGKTPIIGKEAAADWYRRVDPSDGEWSSRNREIVLGTDLAVNWITTDGHIRDEDRHYQGIAIYEKRAGEWMLRFDIWNRSD